MIQLPRTSLNVLPFLFTAVLALLLASPAAASDITGFLPEAGDGVLALSYTDESYDEFWAGEQRTSAPPLGEITTRSTSLWLSWGLTDRLALITSVAHVDVEGDGPANLSDSGLQDLSVLLAARLWRGGSGNVEHSLVGAVGVRTPLESYVANAPVARGDETTDALFRLVYLLKSGRFYWSQQVGFDLRGDDAPDGFPLYTELGLTTGRLTWILVYSRLFANDGTDIGEPGFTFPSNQEEVERLGAKLIGRVNDRWAIYGGGFTTLDGRNTGDATGFTGGLIVHF